MPDFGQRRFHGVRQVQHAKTAIAEPRTRRVDVGKRGGRVRTARNAERDLRSWNQLEVTHFVFQPGIGQRLDLIQHLKLVRIGDIIKQCDRRKLRIDQSVGL
ncbi:hypothetical protein D3C87_1387810 [compost metagenome]